MNIKRYTLLIILVLVLGPTIYALALDISLPSSTSSAVELSLADCIKYAMDNSFDVKLARLDLLIAETDRSYAEAAFDTAIFGNLNYSEDRMQALSVFGADLTQTNIYSMNLSKKLKSGTEFDISLSDTRTWNNSGFVSQIPAHETKTKMEVRQALGKNYFGYIDRRDITLTDLAIKNADLDTKESIELLLADVEKAYWRWASSKTSLGIYRDILSKAKDLHTINIKNHDIGRIEKGDLLASQANVLTREKDVRLAENSFRKREENIKLLMNMARDKRIMPKQDLLESNTAFSMEGCLKDAFGNRRDYKKAKRDLQIKSIRLETKENEMWPEIDLVASFTANGIDSSVDEAITKMVNDNNTKYYAGIEISLPIENNLARSNLEKATHQKGKAIIEIKSIERTIITEVGNAYRDYNTNNSILTNLETTRDLQNEKLKEEEKRFGYGRSSTRIVIDYQQDYLRSELAVVLGILSHEISRIDLEKSLNVILKKHERMI